jgi:hypothetical protein
LFFNGTVLQWESWGGIPSLYFHNQTLRENARNSSAVHCSFGSAFDGGYWMNQNINLNDYSLFIDSGEAETTLSAYFGASLDDECEEGQAEVWFYDPSMVSIKNSSKWAGNFLSYLFDEV